ncbi:hypothetical protein CVT26_007435 [Gymnopilus dilepis]|uniref:Uncharacterized protein n=1 Tax=Gymnopilus dilepis TaxID=231916 RepID=A0A409WIS2_9AGAR|nr:hypothetical protein CVT26_007435 [Gymnopilus dilepis]
MPASRSTRVHGDNQGDHGTATHLTSPRAPATYYSHSSPTRFPSPRHSSRLVSAAHPSSEQTSHRESGRPGHHSTKDAAAPWSTDRIEDAYRQHKKRRPDDGFPSTQDLKLEDVTEIAGSASASPPNPCTVASALSAGMKQVSLPPASRKIPEPAADEDELSTSEVEYIPTSHIPMLSLPPRIMDNVCLLVTPIARPGAYSGLLLPEISSPPILPSQVRTASAWSRVIWT